MQGQTLTEVKIVTQPPQSLYLSLTWCCQCACWFAKLWLSPVLPRCLRSKAPHTCDLSPLILQVSPLPPAGWHPSASKKKEESTKVRPECDVVSTTTKPLKSLYNTVDGKLRILLWHCIIQWTGSSGSSSGTVLYSGREAPDPPLALYNTVDGKLRILLWHCIIQWTGSSGSSSGTVLYSGREAPDPPLALYNTVDGKLRILLWHCIIQWKWK